MLWMVVAFLAVYGLTFLLFAFVQPPGFLSHLFKVPAVFGFLPGRWPVTAGRVFMGIICLVGAVVFALRVAMA